MERNKGISLIICCYNSAGRIQPTLQHIAFQKIPSDIPFEILLIDNNSNDNTSIIAQKIWQGLNSDFPFSIIAEKKQGLSHARKKGLKLSKYEYILFCDDDNWLEKNYVKNTFHILEKNKKIGAVGGWGILSCNTDPPEWVHKTNAYGIGKPIPQTGYTDKLENMIYGAGMGLRFSAYQKLIQAGFDFQLPGRKGNELSGGEDVELFFGLLIAGYKIAFDEKLQFKHFLPEERLQEKYIIKLSQRGIKNSAIIAAYYHEYKKFPLNSIFFHSWILKNKLKTQQTNEGDFIDKIKMENRKKTMEYLKENKQEYFETRKKIRAWSNSL